VRICAFLDLLGFRDYTLTDTMGAHRLLINYQTILNQKMIDQKSHPASSYPSMGLQETAEKHLIDSFEYFLPFSDSIFIISNKPDKFIKQISSLLLDCFILTSDVYAAPENKGSPTEVTRTSVELDNEGKLKTSESKERWYPTLFRGGISVQEVTPIDMNSIVARDFVKITNLASQGVVESVKLEQLDKGPRVFCAREFNDSLSPNIKYLMAPYKDGKHFEMLWPAIHFNEFNDCRIEISQFNGIFIAGANLWNSSNHTEEGIHYYKFLKLIVKSALSFFQWRGYQKQAEDYILAVIRKSKLELKIDDLMNSEFI
jgi:hypothetical protein